MSYVDLTNVSTVCASLCQPIHLAYDSPSFLQVVLCHHLLSTLPARRMLFVLTHTLTLLMPQTQRNRHLQSVCHLFCWHLWPLGIVGYLAICCRRSWIWRGQTGTVHHAALLCWSELLWSVVLIFLLFHSYWHQLATLLKQQGKGKQNFTLSNKCNCAAVTVLKVIGAWGH